MKILKELSKRQKNGKLKYYQEKECHCGTVFVTRKDGNAKSCGCINKELNKKRRLGKPAFNRIKNEDFTLKIAKKIFKSHGYQDGNLTFNEFLELTKKNCYYCGSEPLNFYHPAYKKDGTTRIITRYTVKGESYKTKSSHGYYIPFEFGFKFNGLDRINQKDKHDLNNVVPCCKNCNFMKRDLNLDEFLNKIKEIYECQQKKNS